MDTRAIDAAVRSTVVRASTISTLWGETANSFRCEHCGRRQFLKKGRRQCIVCHAVIPQGRIFRPPPPPARMGHWICKRLKSVRLQKGLPQKILAGLVPCNRTYISKYENLICVPSYRTVGRIATALQVEPINLLDRSIPVSQFATAPMLDAAELAGLEALMDEIERVLPQLCEGARATLLNIARGLASGQRSFEEWITVN